LSANKTLARIAPYLQERDVLFKAPCSLDELAKLNAGPYYGYSQVGKFITVYPRNDSEAVFLASQLDRLTRGLPAPVVPFDSRFEPGSNVFYRYGSFSLKMSDDDAISSPDGKLMIDCREQTTPPTWVVDPFAYRQIDSPQTSASLLDTPFRVIRALSQRGKGGVYEGVDFRFDPPRRCIIKQGRRTGEVGWHGKDGAWMLKKEAEILRKLARAGIDVPATYLTFRLNDDFYLVMEQIEGETLQAYLEKRKRRLPISMVLSLAKQIWLLLTQIHNAGWAWLDCKPANLIFTPHGKLRPVDFEGAGALESSRSIYWQTSAFMRPAGIDYSEALSSSDDLYAFGVTCYFLLTGQMPEKGKPNRIRTWRPGVPKQLENLVEGLLNFNISEDEINRLLTSD
jgi:serine/threonine protein kinase